MDPLASLKTALTDRYRVERQIGVGGMATVYLARDLRHDRNVALKLLKPELGAVLGVERFLSEIRVTANLQHPHLLPLFDSGEADGLLYYVMPYVEGETLRGRLDREKQLPVSEALRITIAVAGALDYAHRHNVVHRDLKPENILLQDGQPVVSDFGIALAVTNAGGTRVTQTGLSLGTPQYMSPEQATGDRVIDARSDIYSLAAVLYEMLIGEPPHTGATIQAIIARVLTDKPRSVRATRDMVPENVDVAIQRALAKLPADRFATAKEFSDALQDPRFSMPVTSTTAAIASTRPVVVSTRAKQVVPWLVAAGAMIIAAVSLTRKDVAAPTLPPVRFALELPDSLRFESRGGMLAISNDGRHAAFIVRRGGVSQLVVRSMDEPELRFLPGTDGATRPFFSPDGESIGFQVDGRIRTVRIASGGATTVVGTGASGNAMWDDAGIVYVSDGKFMRVPASGGTPVIAVSPDSGRSLALPSPGPDGRILGVLLGDGFGPELAISDGQRARGLGIRGFAPQWVESGHILFNTAEANLMALPFDRQRLRATADPFLLLDGVQVMPSGAGAWRAAPNGSLIVSRGNSSFGGTLGIVDRTGRFTPLSDQVRRYRLPRLSPDQQLIAVQIGQRGTNVDSDIWILNRNSGALSRFTTTTGNSDPVWSIDGNHLAFAGPSERDSANRVGGAADLFSMDVDRSSPPKILYSEPGSQWPWAYSPDGRTLIFDAGPNPTSIRALDVATGIARDVVSNQFINRLPDVSPDGKWLAYSSNETGQVEIYIRPFPGPGGATQISLNGGDQPQWSADGRELYYRDGQHMIAATIREGVVTGRTALFEDTFDMSNATNYDVLKDGKFIMMRSRGEAVRLEILVNWLPEIQRRVPAAK
jgi:Tol biopolymer transport system component